MGYRKIPTIHTIDDVKDEPGLIVRVKGVSFGKVRKLLTLVSSEEKDELVVDKIASMLADNLVSWNLEDEHGTPVPPVLAALDDLEFDFVMKVVNTWLDRMTGTGDELGKDSKSGDRFPGQPVTMEAL